MAKTKDNVWTKACECKLLCHVSNLNLILTKFPCFLQLQTKPMSMLPAQHAKRSKQKLLALICLLTCPLVVLQVRVVPCSKPPDCRRGSKSCGWQVSSEGRCRDSRGRISHGCLHPTGYHKVNINGSTFLVHRLIVHAFHGPPRHEAAVEVNHIDGNRSNNGKDNLEWVTSSQNSRHSYANLSRHFSIPSKRRQALIRPIGSQEWTTYSSVKLASEATGQPHKTLYARCSRNSQVDGYEYSLAALQQAECPGEEWRPMKCPRTGLLVPGRAVSSSGRIKSKRGHIYFGTLRKDGYFRTQVKLELQHRNEFVHRLVAASFLGQPPSPEHTQINHKDGNKSNNARDNLEYVTPAENNAHRCANLKGPHPSSKAVLSRGYETNEEWTRHPSVTSAAKALALPRGSVSACARGVRKQTGGYEFRLEEPEPHVIATLPGEVWREVDLEAHLRDREKRRNCASSHP